MALPGTLGDTAESMPSIFGIPLIEFPSGGPEPAGDAEEGQLERFERYDYTITGVLSSENGISLNFGGASLYIPFEQARSFWAANRAPLERLGEILAGDTGYQSVEVRVMDLSFLEKVKSEIEKRGFNYFNLSNQIEQIERVFLIINVSLALLGGIALLVASFGISNTMIMSIRERKREIGIMKAIGGSDGEIMRIFFVEASLIGFTGGALGVISGWAVDRVANVLANEWMVRQAGQALKHVEFFAIPWYLSGGAILFAVIVSLVAAIYPALSAARVDPIKALRYE